MSKIFEYMKPYTGTLMCVAALLFIEAYCALVLPGFMADIVNDGVLPGHLSVIWRNGLLMLLITLLSVVAALVAGYFAARTSTGVANDLREAVFYKVLRFSNAEINKFATSSLITRTTNDITQIQSTMMMAIRQFIYAPIIGVGGIIRALNRSGSMTWVIALATLCMIAVLLTMAAIAVPKFKIVQTLIDRLNLVSRENLSGILVVRAFSTQKFEKKRFDKANRDLAETNLFIDQAFAFVMPAIMLILNLTTAFIVWIGAGHVSAFRIDIGDIFAFLQYGLLIIFAFLMLAIMFILLPRAIVSAERVKEVLETEGGIVFKKDPLPLPADFKGTLEFRDVSFRYPDAQDGDDSVLTNISFTARPGQTTAIIGATGAGKTSLFKLILRFFDVTGGGIYVDGIDIRDVNKQDLHDKIGYVPQKAVLFSGTIRSNLLYADKNATDERITDAVDTAQSKGFIEGKPDGYESNVAQGGSNFSGGQRQRLSIARALVKKAQIYLFDDSFSALDLKTDALLRASLKRKMGGSTILVIAQRVSSIMDADQILVLDHGKIASCGTHAELMKTCEVYREIAASQLSEEEAEGGIGA
ncbi:MAG: ABC transporter ATP-binding protein/permease [Defluviitaleaceae bacterium]|nr:ABC transporter ATP-binding protein/permease [Defluviitaleaceae bacterium]